MLVSNIKEEQYQHCCDATDRQINPEAPSPGYLHTWSILDEPTTTAILDELTKLANNPPITGPTPPANAQIPSVNPMSKLRCLKLNKSLIHTCTSRISPPPAAPWNDRPTISSCMFFETAQIVELAKKRASAASMMILRPHMSDNEAQMGPEAAFARRYAPPIQV